MRNLHPIVKILLVLWLIITVFFCLIKARDFLIPVALSVLISFMLYPLARLLEGKGIPRILTNFIVILLAGAVLFGVIFFTSKLVGGFLKDIPTMKHNFLQNVSEFQETLNDWAGITEERQDRWVRGQSSMIYDSLSNYARIIFSATATTIFKFFLLPVYVFLILFYRDKFRIFLYQIVPDRKQITAEKIINEISHVATRYISGMVVVVSILIVLNSTGLFIIGVKHALFFGVIAAIFNFIPYLGTIIGYIVVFIFAMATQDLNIALRIIPLFFIIQFTENNILTPNIAGSRVKVNPMVAIMSIIVAGTIWGLAGMFVVIPFLAMLMIYFRHTEGLQSLAFLMSTSGTEEHALTWNGIKHKFQKWFNKENGNIQ